MKVAHKDGLLKKVSAGDASTEDRTALLDLYISLTESKPKKGEAASWTAKTNAIVLAAAKVAVGRKGAEEGLKKATNCGACHSKHK